jgi:hypothetical protein
MLGHGLVGLGLLLGPLCTAGVLAQDASRSAPNARNAISISATLPYPSSRVFLAVARAVSDLGFAVADSSMATGELKTAPSYAWPAGSEAEQWHGVDSPGVVLHVIAKARGADSTFFGVTAIAPIRSVARGDSAASTLRTLSALRVANRVSTLLKEPVAPRP